MLTNGLSLRVRPYADHGHTEKLCVHDRINALCTLRTEIYSYFGSPAPQAEPQADAGFSTGFGSAAPQAEPQADAGFSSSFGSAAPQAEPQDDAANAATFSRLLIIVCYLLSSSAFYILDFPTSLVYTQYKLQQSKTKVRTILLCSDFFLT